MKLLLNNDVLNYHFYVILFIPEWWMSQDSYRLKMYIKRIKVKVHQNNWEVLTE